jgi:hypothetical protein
MPRCWLTVGLRWLQGCRALIRQQVLASAQASVTATVVVDNEELPPQILPLSFLPSDAALSMEDENSDSLPIQQSAAPAAEKEGLKVCNSCCHGNLA